MFLQTSFYCIKTQIGIGIKLDYLCMVSWFYCKELRSSIKQGICQQFVGVRKNGELCGSLLP